MLGGPGAGAGSDGILPGLARHAPALAHFGGQGEAEAAAEVLGHLKRQWEPRMRRQIVEIWRSGGGDFSPVGRAAIALLAAETTRPAG